MLIPFQTNRITIEEVYHITKDGLTNLLTNEIILFEDYSKDMDENYNYDLLNVFELQMVNHYLFMV